MRTRRQERCCAGCSDTTRQCIRSPLVPAQYCSSSISLASNFRHWKQDVMFLTDTKLSSILTDCVITRRPIASASIHEIVRPEASSTRSSKPGSHSAIPAMNSCMVTTQPNASSCRGYLKTCTPPSIFVLIRTIQPPRWQPTASFPCGSSPRSERAQVSHESQPVEMTENPAVILTASPSHDTICRIHYRATRMQTMRAGFSFPETPTAVTR